MVLLDIIKLLQEEGFEIKYRKRSDGGYIITKINGVSYRGASGNKMARELTGATISEAKIQQMAFNVKKFIKGHKKPKMELPEDLTKELRKVQKLMRSTKTNGKITKRKLREQYSKGGRRQARRYLREATKYTQGIAYEDNVMWLRQRIEKDASSCSSKYPAVSKELYRIANKIWRERDSFRESWINTVYSHLYDVEKGIAYNIPELIKSGIKGIIDIIS